jgi:hypothetical protein
VPDHETWRFINSFAPWLSALGTLAAVILSLHLARRSERPRIRTRITLSTIVGERQPIAQGLKVLDFSVCNLGARPITVKNLCWQTGVLRKRHYIQIAPSNAYSARMPVKLDHGDTATFVFPLDELPAKDDAVAKAVGDTWWPALAVRCVRAGS